MSLMMARATPARGTVAVGTLLGKGEAQVHRVLLHRRAAGDQERLADAGEARPGLAGTHDPRPNGTVHRAARGFHLGAHGRLAPVALHLHFPVRIGGGAVDVAEVGHIDAVLRHGLQRAVHEPLVLLVFSPLRTHGLRELLDRPQGRGRIRVVPRPHEAVLFLRGPVAHAFTARLRRDHLRIGNLAHHAGAIVAPGMERALQIIPVHAPTKGHVGAKVTTVRIEHARPAVGAAPQGKIASEIAHRLHLTGGELVAVADGEPAKRQRQIDAALGGARPAGVRPRCASAAVPRP